MGETPLRLGGCHGSDGGREDIGLGSDEREGGRRERRPVTTREGETVGEGETGKRREKADWVWFEGRSYSSVTTSS